ncbi:Cytidylyltransferase family protein [Theileria parva strain Muguga]|uniref:Cytidyltransferase-like domain-containing protein n=1 Tax=Theileria parva TaxID=5875 RepID=Q4N375_THEPA|nr:Cytidylyltransferase family protein [Theileria parva strain Muguga]EAN31464.1 Cytidylyltransferase family protein [Theileria parva strain Muguga]|eukprot:XP_763747.1 hypothetical protein [Theileria parva strain Muguga]
MKIILHDTKLSKLLHHLIKSNENNFNVNNSNEDNSNEDNFNVNNFNWGCVTSRPGPGDRCGKCILCVLEENIRSISRLICNILQYVKDLLIYLKLDQHNFLQSTITLNYIKALYSSILTHYLAIFNRMDIMNNEQLDVIIIPIYKIPNQPVTIIQLNDLTEDPDANTFLYFNNPFLYHPFYSQHSNTSHYSRTSDTTYTSDDTDDTTKLSDLSEICHGVGNNSSLWIRKYDNIMFCGTFDYLHFGHKLLLLAAYLSCGKKLSIGVSTGALLKNKPNHNKIQHISKRIQYLHHYLHTLTHIHSVNVNTVDMVNITSGEIINYDVEFNVLCDQIEDNIGGNCLDPNVEKIITNNTNLEIKSKVDRASGNKNSHLNHFCCSQNTINTITINTTDNNTSNSNSNNNSSNGIEMMTFELEDVIGPSSEIREGYGLLVTSEILSNGVRVNKQRKELGLVQWDLINIGLVCYQHNHKHIKLSSTTIRNLIP